MEETKTDEIPEIKESSSSEETKGAVPYERFNEVNSGLKEANSTIETLEEEIETLKEESVEEKTPDTWEEVTKIATEKAVEKVEKQFSDKATEEARIDAIHTAQIDALKGLGHKISEKDEIAIYEQMITKDQDLITAFGEISKAKETATTAEQQKTEGFIPPKTGGGAEGAEPFSYAEIRSKSVDDIIDEAQRL